MSHARLKPLDSHEASGLQSRDREADLDLDKRKTLADNFRANQGVKLVLQGQTSDDSKTMAGEPKRTRAMNKREFDLFKQTQNNLKKIREVDTEYETEKQKPASKQQLFHPVHHPTHPPKPKTSQSSGISRPLHSNPQHTAPPPSAARSKKHTSNLIKIGNADKLDLLVGSSGYHEEASWNKSNDDFARRELEKDDIELVRDPKRAARVKPILRQATHTRTVQQFFAAPDAPAQPRDPHLESRPIDGYPQLSAVQQPAFNGTSSDFHSTSGAFYRHLRKTTIGDRKSALGFRVKNPRQRSKLHPP